MPKFEMHEKAKDTISGFTGLIVARTEWDNGCVRYALASEKLEKDGKIMEPQWIDEQNLVSLAKSKVVATKSAGGPPIHGDPRR